MALVRNDMYILCYVEAVGKDRQAYTLLSVVNVQVKLLQLSNFGHSSLFCRSYRCLISHSSYIYETKGESSSNHKN